MRKELIQDSNVIFCIARLYWYRDKISILLNKSKIFWEYYEEEVTVLLGLTAVTLSKFANGCCLVYKCRQIANMLPWVWTSPYQWTQFDSTQLNSTGCQLVVFWLHSKRTGRLSSANVIFKYEFVCVDSNRCDFQWFITVYCCIIRNSRCNCQPVPIQFQTDSRLNPSYSNNYTRCCYWRSHFAANK